MYLVSSYWDVYQGALYVIIAIIYILSYITTWINYVTI